jgi:uncharacterized protein YheU (UPF0270 family)
MNDWKGPREDALQPPVEVPFEAVGPEALLGIIENFILREGTDYGAHEIDHESKIKRVRAQLQHGDVKIIFDPNTESVTLYTKAQWANAKR